jgi:hypothetical protein
VLVRLYRPDQTPIDTYEGFFQTPRDAFTYRVPGLLSGSYKLCAAADGNLNHLFADVGVDYVGCYDGSLSAPIRSVADARTVDITDDCTVGVDFGTGLVQ